MVSMLGFFSLILYTYINYIVENELRETLVKQANYLMANYDNLEEVINRQQEVLKKTLNITAKIQYDPSATYKPLHFYHFKKGGRHYLQAFIPHNFHRQSYLVLTADITQRIKIQQKIFQAMILLNIFAMVLILLYAAILSGMLVRPIRQLAAKLEKMNENILEPLRTEDLPTEFQPLATSINSLVARIKSFLHYKKELFVGTAHELKTPLAVIKTRAQVALIKRDKSVESLSQVLKDTVQTVDDMNRIVGSILQFGRAEGAQFDKPETIDIIQFLRKKAREYALLAQEEGKNLQYRFHPGSLTLQIQPDLLTQILQNLVQNALRYTPKGHTVQLNSFLKDDTFVIKIRDEGPGIDESEDLFAPFKRSKESPGAGLGLFLVKSAADALGATVTLKNRKDGKRGTVATFTLPLQKK